MPSAQSSAEPSVDHAVIVIGAGFSGINAGIRLKAEDIEDFVILERADDVGGTWRDNTYTSVLIYTEAQAKYITQAVKTLLNEELTAIAVKPQIMRRYHDKLQHRMRYTSWTFGCSSWYFNAHGENHTLFPGLATEYALSMRRFKLGEYEVSP